MARCDEFCRPCAYRGQATGGLCCDYLLITGNRRGCPPGTGCTQRVKGKQLDSLESRLFRGRPGRPKAAPTARQAVEAAMKEAERKRRKAEYNREWRARHRERVKQYEEERRQRIREERG